MIALTEKFYGDHRLGIILMTFGLLLYQWMLISLYPIFQKLDIERITQQQPKALLALFGGTGIKLPFSTLEGFFNGEYLALGFLFAMVRERYQSILPSVVAHGMWNCGTFMLVLVLLGGS